MKSLIIFITTTFLILLSACYADNNKPQNKDAFYYNKQLAKTINFANALEAPVEGEWGMVIQDEYFKLVKKAGFSAVRLPIKWSAHALKTPPYTIEQKFFERVDELTGLAKANDINIILDFHHYWELDEKPTENLQRWLSLWQQIGQHYQNESDRVFFELLNEPSEQLNDYWAEYLKLGLTEIRKTNPNRIVIVGPKFWNAIWELQDLELPKDDRNLIVTFHYYEPFEFTHQGAEWVEPSPPLGITWNENKASLTAGWENWSWETNSKLKGKNIEVDYTGAWAGLFLHSDTWLEGYKQLSFSANKSLKLGILCVEDEKEAFHFTTSELKAEYKIDLEKCGGKIGIDRIIIQNFDDKAHSGLVLENIKLIAKDGSELYLVTTQGQKVAADFAKAGQWATAHKRPLFMGEFGAYGKADMASRVSWTNFVRQEAEKNNISWAYWEFGAGFGIYDRDTQEWRADLLKALIP